MPASIIPAGAWQAAPDAGRPASAVRMGTASLPARCPKMTAVIDEASCMQTCSRAVARGLAAVLLGCAVAGAAAETIQYELAPDFARGTLDVTLTWHTDGRARSVLGVSSRWGRIRHVPALLHDMRFSGATARRDGGNWHLAHARGAAIRVSYTVRPGPRSFADWDHTHHPLTTREFFHGMGNAFLLAPRSAYGAPETYEAVLRWKLPAGYDAVCSWGAGRHVGARLRGDDLRQSLYLAGRFKRRLVERGERTITVAMIGDFDFDIAQFAELTARIIDAECEFMVEPGFPDFLISVIPVGDPVKPGDSRLAGTGLYNSFALFLAPRSQLNDALEHLFAHELLHYWNGRILPARQPERQAFWFVEGFTDYYALRILYESGIWNAATYCKWINRHLREYALNPAANATNAQIEAAYWSQRDTVGEVAYQRGLALGLRWHSLARQRNRPGGIDPWFIGLIERGRDGYEIGNPELRATGVAALGAWFGEEFDRFVAAAETVDVPADALAPEIVGEPAPLHGADRAGQVIQFRPR